MFSKLFGLLRFASIIIIAVISLSFVLVVHAGDAAHVCFNFLSAQDYTRAKAEAKGLLKEKNLGREYERDAQDCLGTAYLATGDLRNALSTFLRVEALSRSSLELQSVYRSIGLTYKKIGDFSRAELYLQRALRASRELNDKQTEALIASILASIVHDRGDHDRALTLYKDILSLEPSPVVRAAVLNNIANIYTDRKEYLEGEKLVREALEIGRAQGISSLISVTQISLGRILCEMNDFSGAEQELIDALKSIRLLGMKDREADAYEQLGVLEIRRNNLKAAGNWFHKAEKAYLAIGNAAKSTEMQRSLVIINNHIE